MKKFSYRTVVMLTVDALLINAAVYVALLLRFDGMVHPQYLSLYIRHIPLITAINLLSFLVFRLYSRVWEYASINELFSIFKATTSSLLVIIALIELFNQPYLPRSIYIMSWLGITLLIGTSRLWWRLFRDYHLQPKKIGRRVLIVGAGDAGAMLAREIQSNPSLGLSAVGFIDDDPGKSDKVMLGLQIHGSRSEIPALVREMQIDEIIIAMPSVNRSEVRSIIDVCKQTSASLKILPDIYRSSTGPMINRVRDVQMEDLLGRDAVEIDLKQVSGYINKKTVLVTGAGGSIGSELCRQIAEFRPRQLVILDNCENNLFDIEMELNDTGYGNDIAVELADVKHRHNIELIFSKYRPQVVFHAAAYKHVPMMERHPEEALRNNVLGTLNTAEMAHKYGTEIFVQISTDKAVNPTSVMGATKRIGELIIKDINRTSSTRFTAVRFGNVLGSRGSVIPTFKKQIERGGPVTVTHPDMTRYFMTIPEAVELVIQAGAIARGGEIFVLDMGEPVRIADLARDLIKLYGYQPDEDIEINYTGTRPGEKLYEELFSGREEMAATLHERIFISRKEMDLAYAGINKKIPLLIQKVGSDRGAILNLIARIVPEYTKPDYILPAPKAPQEAVLYRGETLQQKASG